MAFHVNGLPKDLKRNLVNFERQEMSYQNIPACKFSSIKSLCLVMDMKRSVMKGVGCGPWGVGRGVWAVGCVGV